MINIFPLQHGIDMSPNIVVGLLHNPSNMAHSCNVPRVKQKWKKKNFGFNKLSSTDSAIIDTMFRCSLQL